MKESDIKQLISEGNFHVWIPDDMHGGYAKIYRIKFDRLLGHNIEELIERLKSLLKGEGEPQVITEGYLELAYLQWLSQKNYKKTIKELQRRLGDDKSIQPKIDFLQGVILLHEGDKDEALRKFVKCAEESNDQLYVGKALNNIAGIQTTMGQFADAELNYESAGTIFRKLHNQWLENNTLENLATVKKNLGMLDEAISLYTQVEGFYRENRKMKELAQLLHKLAVVQHRRGEYNKALVNYSESMEIREGLDRQIETSWSYLNLGKLYLELGEITQAIENIEKSLVIRKQLGTQFEVAQSLQGMGMIHLRIGNLEVGRGYLMDSLQIFLEQNDYLWTSETLFLIVSSYAEEEDYGKAREFFGVHEELVKSSNKPLIKHRHRLLEGILLTGKERAVDKFKAIEIFEDILNSPLYDFRLYSIAMIELADLYILELRLGKNEELISSLENLLGRMLDASLESQSYPIYIKFLMLNARLKLVQLKANESLQLLKEALDLCEEKGLIRLYQMVQDEIKDMEDLLMGVWNKMIGPNTSLIERLKTASLVDYMNDVSDILKSFQ